MSDEQGQAEVPEPKLGESINEAQHATFHWRVPISEERQAWLRGLADKQMEWAAQPEATRGESVFKGVTLTGADVCWLALYALAGLDAPADALVSLQAGLHDSGSFMDVSTLLLQGADLWQAHLQGAQLNGAQLQGARLAFAHLEDALLKGTQLPNANLAHARLQGAHLRAADLRGADVSWAHLEGANLEGAQLQGANLDSAHLQAAELGAAHLEGAKLDRAHLEGAILIAAQLQGAHMYRARLYGVNLLAANLQGANLTAAYLNSETVLWCFLDSQTRLADVVWNNCPLTHVPWQQAPRLGDETVAWQPRFTEEFRRDVPKHPDIRREEFATAVRANRVLAVTLRSQGMNEDADRYSYRAHVLQRQVRRRNGQWGRAFGSWLLDAIAGYGYKPMRSVSTYGGVILTFAAAYFAITNFAITPFLPTHSTPLAWYEALVLSMSSFHGRGLVPTGLSLGDPVAIFAAVEAVIGLLIEITFIATFTQRFFAR